MKNHNIELNSESETIITSRLDSIKKWGSLFVLSLALAIIVIDTTLLNVSLSTIIRELKTDIGSLQWVISAYSLTLAALTITGGRLGDLFGRKRMFMLGAVIFAIGSFIASISPNVGTLLIGESIVEGIGAALMMPATASLVVANFRGKERAIAFGIWGGVAAASSAIGPILGGYLTNNFSWRWGFRINVFVAAVILIGALIVRESRDTKEKPTLDLVGVILSALGMLSIVYGIIESSKYGWLWAKQPFILGNYEFTIFGLSIVPLVILFGILLLDLFYEWERIVERKGQTPLVSMGIFKNRAFTSGSLTTAILTLGMTGTFFVIPVFLQGVLHLDALNTGLSMLPMSIAMLVMAPLSGFLSTKFQPKLLIQAGLVINVFAMLLLFTTLNVNATARDLMPGLLVFGIGMGMVMAQISNITLSAVPVYQAGEASGLNNTLRQIGSTLGAAIIGAVLLTTVSATLSSGINTSTVIPQQLKPAITEAIASKDSDVEFGGVQQIDSTVPAPIANEITSLANEATVAGTKQAALYASAFLFLGLLMSFAIPKVQKHHS